MGLLPRHRRNGRPVGPTGAAHQDQADQDQVEPAQEEEPAEEGEKSRALGWLAGPRQTARRAAAAAGPWPSRGGAATKGFLALVLAAVACGPAALVLAATHPATTPTTATTPAGSDEQDRTAVDAASVQLVHAVLTADAQHADQVKDLVADQPESLTLPDKAPRPPEAITVESITRLPGAANQWRATVLSVGGASDEGQTWQVDVQVDPATGTAQAIRLPAQITTGKTQATRGPEAMALSSTDPAAVTGFGYVTSLLTGASDLSRWTAPGNTVTPISPAACQKVTGDRAETTGTDQPPKPTDGQHLDLVVTVDCTLPGASTDTNIRTLQYPLRLASRGNRWEVAAPSAPTPTPTPTLAASTSAS